MTRRLAVLGVLLSACAVGPGYHPTPVVPPATKVGTAASSESSKTFFDSLAAARAADTVPGPAATELMPPRSIRAESLADLAWLDILHDSLLNGLVTTALHQNRDLAVAEARVREYRAVEGVARAPLFPSLTATGAVSRQLVVLAGFAVAPVDYSLWLLEANVSWELDFWGRIRRGLQAATADLRGQEAAERAAALSIVAQVASGYLTLLELDQEQVIAEQTLAGRREEYQLAERRYAQGVVSELDVRQFEAQIAIPAARLAQVQQLRSQQEHALNALVGEGPAPIRRGTSLLAAVRAIAVPDSLPSTLLERRPDVQESERAYAAAVARVGAADAARLPTFTISGYGGTQSATAGDIFSQQTGIYQALAGFSLPLFTGGRLVNQARAARARADQAHWQYEQTVLTALREAGDALVAARSARDQVTALDTQAKALRRGLQLAQVRYTSGLSNYLEVLDAQRSLFDAEIALSQAELGQLNAAVQLYKALGGSWGSAH